MRHRRRRKRRRRCGRSLSKGRCLYCFVGSGGQPDGLCWQDWAVSEYGGQIRLKQRWSRRYYSICILTVFAVSCLSGSRPVGSEFCVKHLRAFVSVASSPVCWFFFQTPVSRIVGNNQLCNGVCIACILRRFCPSALGMTPVQAT